MSSYRGRPSKGCDPCRAKKVKCDEGKPVCNRCSKARVECKYRDQADLLFRNQTAFAAQKAEESWRKRSRSSQAGTVNTAGVGEVVGRRARESDTGSASGISRGSFSASGGNRMVLHQRSSSQNAFTFPTGTTGGGQIPGSSGMSTDPFVVSPQNQIRAPQSASHQRSSSESTNQSSTQSTPHSLLFNTSHMRSNSYATSPQTPESFHSSLDFNDLSIVPLRYDLRRLAYERFIYDFVIFDSPNRPPDEPSAAMWDFIPYLYEKAEEGSCLATTVDAVAYGNFASRCHAPQAFALAEECAAKSIKLLQTTVADKVMAASNDALCAVYLIGIVGVLMAPKSVSKESFLAHTRGARALLQLRTIDQHYADAHSARLFELIVWQQLISALQHANVPPISVAELTAANKYISTSLRPSVATLMLLVHREAQLHAKWHETKHSSHPPTTRNELEDFLQTALELDADLQEWESMIPHHWRYRIDPNTASARAIYDPKWRDLFLGSRGSPKEIHSYNKLNMCWIWVFYRTTRILVLRDLLEVLNWMFKLAPPSPPLSEHMFGTQHSTSSSSPSAAATAAALDNARLKISHNFATTQLASVVEKSTAAMFGIFNASIYGKVDHDIVGMRGYIMMWSLGVMDAVLKTGLVPDAGSPITQTDDADRINNLFSFQWPTEGTETEVLGQSQFNMTMPDQMEVWNEDSMNASGSHTAMMSDQMNIQWPAEHQLQANDFSAAQSLTLPAVHHYHSNSASLPLASISPSRSQSQPMPSSPPAKAHIYDSSPTHPFDLPSPQDNHSNNPHHSTDSFTITKLTRIDVAARREWINRMLYFIASEMGIRTAFAVPATEGFMEVCKRGMDEMLGAGAAAGGPP